MGDKVYSKNCPVCHKDFQSTSRNAKYCSEVCNEFSQRRVGKLRKRRRIRNMNRQFHLEWVRRHREDREKFLAQTKVAICQDCGKVRLTEIKEVLSRAYIALELTAESQRPPSDEALLMISNALQTMQEFEQNSVVLLKDLEVHHIDANFQNGDISNLGGYCPVCHNKAESALRKAGKPTDEEPERKDENTATDSSEAGG